MVTIYNGRAIKIAWTIFKGVSAVKENFDRANVVCFLIDHRRNKINVSCRQEQGTIYVDIPEESLLPGIYSIELLWAKNRDFTRPHNWEIAPWVLNHTFLDSRNIVRCLKEDLFAVTEYEEEESSMIPDEGTVVIKAKSSAATYGYDGLDAYEMSVVFGYTTLSRDEWLAQLNDPQTWFMKYLGELIRLNNLKAPGSRTFNVTKVAGNWTYNGEDTATEGLPYSIQVIANEHYAFDTEHLSLTMGGYPITNETEGVSITWANENKLLTIAIDSVAGHIRIEPTAIAESGTITLQADTSGLLWRWLDGSNQPITSPINGSYDTETVVYLEILDPSHYELPNDGIYYGAGGGSCEISKEKVTGTNKYEVRFTHLSGDVEILVTLNQLTISINGQSLVGFTIKKYVGDQEVSTVYNGDDVTIRLYPSAFVRESPTFKVGDGTPQSFHEPEGDGWYATINHVQETIYLFGYAAIEDRLVWGEYDQDSFVTQAIVADLMQNAQTMFDNAVLAGNVVNTEVTTPNITTNSFFVCYPTDHFPNMVETQFGTAYSDTNDCAKATVTINGNTGYVIWAFMNTSYDPIGGKVRITKR